jgi:hypothetical protein
LLARGALGVCALVLAGACSSGGTTASSSAPSVVPSAATATAEAAVITKPEMREDGKVFGYIRSVDAGSESILFDRADLYQGDAADRKAAEDGVIEPGAQVENDYYIENKNAGVRKVSYASDVKIRVIGDPPDLVVGDLNAFVAGFQNTEAVPFDGAPTYRGSHTQYWITLKKGTIVKIDELYLP